MIETKDAGSKHKSRTKSVRRAIFWGVVSLAMYLSLFLNQEAITRYFTKGGASAIAIVVTALAFSVVVGNFANYILELIGIRPLDKGDR